MSNSVCCTFFYIYHEMLEMFCTPDCPFRISIHLLLFSWRMLGFVSAIRVSHTRQLSHSYRVKPGEEGETVTGGDQQSATTTQRPLTGPPCIRSLTGKLCNLSYPGWTDLFAPPFTREINPWWLRLPTGLCSVWAAGLHLWHSVAASSHNSARTSGDAFDKHLGSRLQEPLANSQ